jgi:ParB family chromosome partitioning protein
MKNKPDNRIEDFGPELQEVHEINMDRIIPNRFQPRKTIDQKSLKELIDEFTLHLLRRPES